MVYINGEWRETENKLDVINPASGEVLETISTVGKDEAKEAIANAKTALSKWKKKTGEERGGYLTEVVRIMKEKADEMALTITKENGKPISQAKGEVNEAIGHIQWYAEEAKRIYGDILPSTDSNKHLMVYYEPVGVSAAIMPSPQH